MKYITFVQRDTRARSGHCLKDIMTTYILSFLIDNLEVLPHITWNEQQIINFTTPTIPIDMNVVKITQPVEHWHGISFDTLLDIMQQIGDGPANTLYELTGVIRIHPVQLTEWYECGLLKHDIFMDKFLPTLRELYFKNRNSVLKNQLSIHVRRGDVADPGSVWYNHENMLWPVEHYLEQMIQFQHDHPDMKIKIFSESSNSSDLLELSNYKNVEIKLGNTNTLRDDIHEMICSDHFMPSNSSLSTWIAYITMGRVIYPRNKKIKHFHKKIMWYNDQS